MADTPKSGLQLRSLIKESGELELSLVDTPIAEPKPDQIVVKVEATPINPSDLGLLTGPADLSTLKSAGGTVTAAVPERLVRAVAARLGQSLPVGNEGAGTVVAAGSSAEAQKLIGRRVTLFGGAMYAQYRTARVADVMVLPEGTSAADGASCFVNPLTALGMTESMKREGHTALLHTAAASNLGQMLVKICLKDGIELVNVVRSPAQVKILKEIGAKHVVDSSEASFVDDLTAALETTGATIGFDAIGGGKLPSQILNAMEVAANCRATEYSRYGSNTFKQLYIYGALDMAPTELTRAFGFSWSLSGWLLPPFLQKIGPEAAQALRERVIAELKTTFASHYTKTISLKEALDLDTLRAYSKRATGEKYLIDPTL